VTPDKASLKETISYGAGRVGVLRALCVGWRIFVTLEQAIGYLDPKEKVTIFRDE
jgi:hypothetical protein